MRGTCPFPKSDPKLLQWSINFLALIQSDREALGLVAADVLGYEQAHGGFSDALLACDPAVRNKTGVVSKNAARAFLKDTAVRVATKVWATAGVSDAQMTQLGIPPRAAAKPIAKPETAPVIQVISSSAWTVSIRLRAAGGTHRGKLPDTSGALVFSYVGTSPPADLAGWKFEGSHGRVTKIDITFATSLPAGAKCWFAALWFNGRKQSGPVSAAVGTNLPGGSVQIAT